MTDAARRMQWKVLAGYFLLVTAWVLVTRLCEGSGSEPLAYWGGRVANPLLWTAATLVLARRWGAPGAWLRFGPAAFGPAGVALAAGLPAVGVLAYYAATQGAAPLASVDGAMLFGRIVLNQAWLEELQARGLLLGVLFATGLGARRRLWVSTLAFAFMHVIQHLIPPVTVEGLVTAGVLVVITLPAGLAFALLTLRAQSIWPAVILHLLLDLLILVQRVYWPSFALVMAATLLVPMIVLAWWWVTRRGGEPVAPGGPALTN